jgi:hypothetical protein
MPSPIRISVGTRAAVVWSGRPAPGISTLLLMNTDLNNTVCIGSEPNVMFNGDNTIPILPNGSLSVDPASAWWVVGAVTGSAPLVMVPNGQSNFLGITQGLGQLVIPSIRSPNFLAGVSGWQIAKDGSAEFNNVVIRGGTVISGLALYYDPVPGLGNLDASIAATAGTDPYGNAYVAGVASYGFGTAVSYLVQGRAVFNTADSTYITISGAGTLTIRSITESLLIDMPVRDIFAVLPGTSATEEIWHAGALINSWANNAGFGAFKYRKVASPPNSVEVTGAIAGTAATAATFFTLPAGYIPASAGGRLAKTSMEWLNWIASASEDGLVNLASVDGSIKQKFSPLFYH